MADDLSADEIGSAVVRFTGEFSAPCDSDAELARAETSSAEALIVHLRLAISKRKPRLLDLMGPRRARERRRLSLMGVR